MNDGILFSELITYGGILGLGATAVMDLWAAFLKRMFGIASLNYGLVGRWLG